MVRMPTGARSIAARQDTAEAARVLLLAAFMVLSLLASALYARADVPTVAPPHSIAVMAGGSADVVSSAMHDGSGSVPCQTHGHATVPCGSASFCSGGACQAPLDLVAWTALFLPDQGPRALPMAEAAKPGSLPPDMFRPPIA